MVDLAVITTYPEIGTSFIAARWEAPILSEKWRYYDSLLYFMGLLHASGYFKIYNLY
jgi:endo-1,4-beta-D-glucanase Y